MGSRVLPLTSGPSLPVWGSPQLVRTARLDPQRNYLFAFHPHGVLAAGAFANFCTEATGFGVLFPGLRPHLLTLPCWFRLPLWREYVMCGGGGTPKVGGLGGAGGAKGYLGSMECQWDPKVGELGGDQRALGSMECQ